jgi:hypothetical protein
LTLALRWDGPRLTRQQLAAKAEDAIARADHVLRHVAMDVEALPSEEQQYVQIVIRTECSDEDVEKLKQVLRGTFSQSGRVPARPTTAAFVPRPNARQHFDGDAAESSDTSPSAPPTEANRSSSWFGLVCFLLLILAAALAAALALIRPFVPDDVLELLRITTQ